MARAKILNLKLKDNIKKVFMALAVLLFISFLLKFQVVADFVAGIILPNDPEGSIKIQSWASTGYTLTMGGVLIIIGISALASPFVGLSLLAVGVGMVAFTIYNKWINNPSKEK